MNPAGPPYTVSVSGATRELLVRLSDRAEADGRIESFLAALGAITERLQRDPVPFGEEVFDLRAMGLTIRVGVVLPLAVEFGVHPTRRVVFVRTFRYITPG